ncbi:MAG: tRNA (adenosine(37)-N6)-threonylcarbamoyltransferase complex ATPase subunit type 1 TsaE [Planctomycetaceae bacterium]|nr:tRNA (adenosine(37)-N6)-threonylcarbamoyltransferase complex ATPase subunit type 1 TsaE [Planctomycetaceae bacterium]
MQSFCYLANSEIDTTKLGTSLTDQLPASAMIALCGTLGAGKTRLVKAIAQSYGVPAEAVVSPTFTLCNEYIGRRPIFHFDMYRIADEDELHELGFEEYLQRPGLTIVEWADRFAEAMPIDKLTINLDVLSETARQITLTAETATYENLLEVLAKKIP